MYHVDLVSDTEATALTYHTSHQTKTATPNRCTKIVARYHDTLRKVDGTWKIADKVMEIGWIEETGSTGPEMADGDRFMHGTAAKSGSRPVPWVAESSVRRGGRRGPCRGWWAGSVPGRSGAGHPSISCATEMA